MVEKRTHCGDCGTRLEESDPKKGGDRDAYYAQVYICPVCKKIGDAYDATADNNRKSGISTNGIKVRIITADQLETERRAREYMMQLEQFRASQNGDAGPVNPGADFADVSRFGRTADS